LAAATYGSAIFASPLFVVYAIVALSLAILLIGRVMLKGVFNSPTAYLGLATGVSGMASMAGWGMTVIVNAPLATVWLLFVRYRLCVLARNREAA